MRRILTVVKGFPSTTLVGIGGQIIFGGRDTNLCRSHLPGERRSRSSTSIMIDASSSAKLKRSSGCFRRGTTLEKERQFDADTFVESLFT
jgi:hypothetical protein